MTVKLNASSSKQLVTEKGMFLRTTRDENPEVSNLIDKKGILQKENVRFKELKAKLIVAENKVKYLKLLHTETLQELNMKEEQHNKNILELNNTIGILTTKLRKIEKTEHKGSEEITNNKIKGNINSFKIKYNELEDQKTLLQNSYNQLLAHGSQIMENENSSTKSGDVHLIEKLKELEISREEYKNKYEEKVEELKKVRMKAERLKEVFEKYVKKKYEQETRLEEVINLNNKLMEANLIIKSLENINMLLMEDNNLLRAQHTSEDTNSIEDTFCSDYLDKKSSTPISLIGNLTNEEHIGQKINDLSVTKNILDKKVH